MLRFTARRLLETLVTLFAATFLLYVVITVLPGDPVRALFGFRPVPPDTYAAIRADFRLDDPLLVQYLDWMGGWATGDFGNLYPFNPIAGSPQGIPVRPVLLAAIPHTARLVLASLALTSVIGIVMGLLAVRRGGRVDLRIWLLATTAVAVPTLVVAYVTQNILGWRLGWLPPAGIAFGWTNYVLPTLSVSAATTGATTLLLRTELLNALREPWAMAARAKGLSAGRVVRVHALRPAIVPVATYLAASVNLTIQALVVVEGVFGIPGLGGLIFRAIVRRDRFLLVAAITLLVLVSIAVSTIADLVHGALDPRVRAAD